MDDNGYVGASFEFRSLSQLDDLKSINTTYASNLYNSEIMSMISADLTKVYGNGTVLPELEVDYNVVVSYDANTISQIFNGEIVPLDSHLLDYGRINSKIDELKGYVGSGSKVYAFYLELKQGYTPITIFEAPNQPGVVTAMKGFPVALPDLFCRSISYFDESVGGTQLKTRTFHHTDSSELVSPEELVESTRFIEIGYGHRTKGVSAVANGNTFGSWKDD